MPSEVLTYGKLKFFVKKMSLNHEFSSEIKYENYCSPVGCPTEMLQIVSQFQKLHGL